MDGRAVANYVLDFCDRHGRTVTNLSLQKIVFFCHVWSLIELKRPLIRHHFEAWQFGPVLQYLYRDFRMYDKCPIRDRARAINRITGEKEIVGYDFDHRTDRLLSEIVDFYSRVTPNELVRLSHAKGGPWDKVWNHPGNIAPGMTIDNDAIFQYYSSVRPPFLAQ